MLEGIYFETCPSVRRILFICDRRSGSWVVGVYVEAAFGIRTGVLGSEGGIVSNMLRLAELWMRSVIRSRVWQIFSRRCGRCLG